MHRRNGANLEKLIDLAAVDILRDRERGVPRYNRFRKLFHKPPVRSFEQMTSDPDLAKTLREVYGHPDKVDLMVGRSRDVRFYPEATKSLRHNN